MCFIEECLSLLIVEFPFRSATYDGTAELLFVVCGYTVKSWVLERLVHSLTRKDVSALTKGSQIVRQNTHTHTVFDVRGDHECQS